MTSSENTAQPVEQQDAVPTVTFYSTRTGASYETSDPAEITRLRSAPGHTENRDEAVVSAESQGQSAPEPFDPDKHTVREVAEYLSAHPEDYERVVAAEREGQKRAGIVG